MFAPLLVKKKAQQKSQKTDHEENNKEAQDKSKDEVDTSKGKKEIKEQQKNREKRILDMYEDNIQQVKKLKKFSLGRKIPNHVKPFTCRDIKEEYFHINSSAVLRTMTKWAEALQDIFQNPESEIKRRFYQFKNFQNQLINLRQKSRSCLITQIKDQQKLLNAELRQMLNKITAFQSCILSQMESGTSYLKRFTQVRSVSEEMNAITIQFTRKYLCLLIYHLIKAGELRKFWLRPIFFMGKFKIMMIPMKDFSLYQNPINDTD